MVKRGYFFSMDALIAIVLVLIVLLLVPIFHIKKVSNEQQMFFSNDLLQILSTLRIGEINNSEVIALINSTDPRILNRSVLEQALIYYAKEEDDNANELISIMVGGLIPGYYGSGVWVDDEAIFSSGSVNISQLVASKQMVSGIARDRAIEGLSSRVFLKGFSGMIGKKYVYFGGYVGDGNITKIFEMPDSFDITSAYMELDVNGDFELYINSVKAGSYSPLFLNISADRWNLSSGNFSLFSPGNNTVELRFSGEKKYIGGGYFKISYTTDEVEVISSGEDFYRFPGIRGIINLYSSFYVPGNLSSMDIYLHYASDYEVFLNIGDETIYSYGLGGENKITIPDSVLSPKLNYSDLSSKTVPLRLGLRNVSYYEIVFGGTVDAVLSTDLSGSMKKCDIPSETPGECTDKITKCPPYGYCRIKRVLAKEVDKIFIEEILKVPGNSIGLSAYGGDEFLVYNLSDNETALKAEIDAYPEKLAGGTCICCGIMNSTYILATQSNSSQQKAMLMMSDGHADKQGGCGCVGLSDEECAIQRACDARDQHNITIYSVAFGSGADADTLKKIACWNCSANDWLPGESEANCSRFYESNNAEELADLYKEIAENMINLSYTAQTVTSFVNVMMNTTLYSDSYIKFNYTPSVSPTYGIIPIIIETQRFGNSISEGTFNVPDNVEVVDARIASYSADRWTDKASINGVAFYNLSIYSENYHILGDPYIINIPIGLVNIGDNTVRVGTGLGPENDTGGSPDDKVIYTFGVSISGNYSVVKEKAEGCLWNVTYEDGSSDIIPIPPDYSGTDNCEFNATTNCDEYDDDAINYAVCKLFENLDFDNDGSLIVKLGPEDLQIEVVSIGKIPYMWGPTLVEVRVWS